MAAFGLHIAQKGKDVLSRRARGARMGHFLREMRPAPGTRIVDLGGVPEFWQGCPVPLDITVLNLPGWNAPEPPPSHHTFRLHEGDATATPFADGSFDIAVSNSVIEHVGPPDRQARLAGEVRRLAPRYWVQTPSIWFPIEAHSYMPFWWAYPEPVRAWFLARWRRRLPAWSEMVATTTVIRRADLQRMFPDAQIWTERTAGLPKSYVALRR